MILNPKTDRPASYTEKNEVSDAIGIGTIENMFELNLDDYADNLVDLAGAGLIADMCSVASMENRAICSIFLLHINLLKVFPL